MNLPVRVAHLVSHPIQYFAPLYRELARRSEIDLTVFFYSDETVRAFHDDGFSRTIEWDVPLLEGYRYVFCPSAHSTSIGGGLYRRRNVDLVWRLRPYDVVWAHGYAHLTAWLAFLAARATGKPFLLREEQTLARPRPLHRRAVKEAALRPLFSGSWGLYIGEENRRYLEHYGMQPERLFPARYCVDNDFFRRTDDELRPQRKTVRAGLGVAGDAPVILFAGKLAEGKNLPLLLDAFGTVRSRCPCRLLLAGDGALRPALERLVANHGASEIVFAGFLGQQEIARAYAAADVLVLPSRGETWGLVVNEALNFGLPVVVSDRVGCAADLVRPGWNGFVVPVDDAEALAVALERLVADPALAHQFGARGRELVSCYSIEACADGIVAACLAARRTRRRVGAT